MHYIFVDIYDVANLIVCVYNFIITLCAYLQN